MSFLSSLTALELNGLPELQCTWKGSISIQHLESLQSLTTVEILHCKRMLYLFPLSLAQSLVQLQKLVIYSCDELEEMIKDIEDEDQVQIFSKAYHLQAPLAFQVIKSTYKRIARNWNVYSWTFATSAA